MTSGMNPIMEQIHPDDDVVARRQAKGYPRLEPVFDTYSEYLHLEMWLCYLTGLDHAAVVTACALTEASLKASLYMLDFVDAGCKFDRTTWDAIDGMEFGRAANLAKTKGLVTKAEWRELEWIREQIRNAYMHGGTPGWLKDASPADFVAVDVGTGNMRELEGTLGDYLVPQRLARVAADRNACNKVVPFVDGLVRLLTGRALAALDEYRRAHPNEVTEEQLKQVIASARAKGLDLDGVIAPGVVKKERKRENDEPDVERGACC